ncbi:MAG: sulfurtransferase complex subunit TusB [Gammaproteobacteria bacterium]|jgi:tRNA 2-thiouridine synthesizing protein B|nr:sulfurtransferase complex subunit TusB [Gammaproteobacteria bacterium]MBT7227850.1 sulfurtransferase complex subunit TusB [Gammaproteobacteria bacterium]
MSCLHTISKSPGTQLLESCLKIIASGDAILFIEDGTYYANSARKLEAIDKACKIYGLREDMLARAILTKAADSVELIDTARFVKLCCEHDKIVSWF